MKITIEELDVKKKKAFEIIKQKESLKNLTDEQLLVMTDLFYELEIEHGLLEIKTNEND